MPKIITDHLDIWTTAQKQKKAVGRGRAKKDEIYGIKKLRELILELAVQGKLVPQDANDEPASVLLERIVEEKQRLIEEGKIKKQKALPEITEKEILYSLPNGWEWARFGTVAQHNAGKTLDKRRNSGKSRKYLTTSNLYWGYFKLDGVREMLIRDDELVKCLTRKNDLLICEGGEAGRAAVWSYNEKICFQNHVHRARFYCEINPYYGYRFFEKISATGEINQHRKGVGISNMSGKALSLILFPLPPLAEQHRIVAKVDELMALCDQLEQQQAEHQTTHLILVETLLNDLIEAAKTENNCQTKNKKNTPYSCADYFNQLILEHFETLFTTEKSIEQLQQTILQLAVMGKLVPQDPNDEPASVLLEKIAKEKAKLLKEGKIKKQKVLPKIEEDEKQHKLSNGWEYARLGSLANRVGSGSTPRGGKNAYTDFGIPFLRSQNIWNNGIKIDNVAFIPKETHMKMSNTIVYPNDVLLNITGASLGRCTIYPINIGEANVSQHVTIIRPTEPQTKEYLHLCILSPYTQKLIWDRQVGMAREGLSKKVLELFEIPLPPLAEQHRIVKKVNELLALCDALKTNLNKAQTLKTQLADTLVKQAAD